jgi:multiple sugar transport system permease protein
MDMMGRGFGGLHFGQASAYGFILTLVIMLITAGLFAFGRRRFAQ